jgi:ABC-type multidrug transport system ATPase subunit
MKIVLVENTGQGQQPVERTFQQKTVRFGRDAKSCDIVFEQKKYPMVSRQHAELRCQKDYWLLRDANSSYGTYINGQKISQPSRVEIGNSIQFGKSGPVLHVIYLDTEEGVPVETPPRPKPQIPANYEPQSDIPTNYSGSKSEEKRSVSAEVPQKPAPPPIRPERKINPPSLKLLGKNEISPFTIAGNSFWLGRDPHCDVVFEADQIMVSRKHAEIQNKNGNFLIRDNNSFNGTLLNGQRISTPLPVYHNDTIQLGHSGPVLKFIAPDLTPPVDTDIPGQRSVILNQGIDLSKLEESQIVSSTMVFNMDSLSDKFRTDETAQPQLILQMSFENKQQLIIGRSNDCDIQLDGLQISKKHARIIKSGKGILVEDLNSTNGVYVNGKSVSRQIILPNDAVQIGSFQIKVDEYENIGVFDTRSKTRIDSIGITKDVKNRSGKGNIRLLDDISLSVRPNEFIGLLGPSGAGKSTYMDALNGMRPPTAGTVLINNLNLYEHLDSLKQSIGYVPQDDIIHRELTVYRTLYYVAKLRLSNDVSRSEIDQIIEEVLDVTGLAERRNVPINQLSGGQRKRVSIAVELITKPSVIFLDEPTSGLDPATEEKIMKLFRQIAESGRTVILTTHAMENVKLFDKIVILMRGKLVFYGKPSEALKYLNVPNFKELYDRLEEPVEEKVKKSGEHGRFQITEEVAENWKRKFTQTPQFKKNVYEPLKEIGKAGSCKRNKSHRLGIFGSIRQWATLSGRYARVLAKDKFNLFILFAQAPIIAVLVYFVMGANQTRDFAYFALSLCAIWFGTSVGAREIVREKAIYERERMVNLGILPYLSSKLFILGLIVFIQCFLLFLPLKFFHFAGLMPMPGMFFGFTQFMGMLVTAGVGVALGLFISSIVKTSEMATSLIPLILIPQIIFSGLIGVPSGINKVIGLAMPATWSFDTMKRFSTLDTLEEEGAIPRGRTDGKGLYRYIEDENDKIIVETKKKIKDYEKDLQERLSDKEKRARNGERVDFTDLPERPKVESAMKLPKDLSNYITFLHPWMNEIVNQLVLMLMFFILFIKTLVVLRLKDF